MKSALVVVDMWNSHWHKPTAERLDELVVNVNKHIEWAHGCEFIVVHEIGCCRPLPLIAENVMPFVNARPAIVRPSDSFAGHLMPKSYGVRYETDLSGEPHGSYGINPMILVNEDLDYLVEYPDWTVMILNGLGIERAFICGIHLNMCVSTQAEWLVANGIKVQLLEDTTMPLFEDSIHDGLGYEPLFSAVVEQFKARYE